jgi:Rps23 Pro-64 3,4-dihydroxylase Tpa1-like proline 4-hydroxylase
VATVNSIPAKQARVYFFEKAQPLEWAREVSEKYNAAQPFPHIVIDDFLALDFIESIVESFPPKDAASVLRKHSNAYLKRGYRPDDLADSICRSYLYAFNSGPCLQFLESLTGIEGLIPDPYFTGGGLHETDAGGRLGVHTDFNLYAKLNLIRRINLLVFLNKDWRPEYGGNLELWDAGMTMCVKSIEPIFNRCVVFNTDKKSFHGQPEPLTCPESMSRRSIAVYYYTSPVRQISPDSTVNQATDYRARPGTSDGSAPP